MVKTLAVSCFCRLLGEILPEEKLPNEFQFEGMFGSFSEKIPKWKWAKKLYPKS